MKKITTILLSVVLLFSITACSKVNSYQKVKQYLNEQATVVGKWKTAYLRKADNTVKAYYAEDSDTIFLEVNEEGLTLTIGLTENSESFFWQGQDGSYTMSGLGKVKNIYPSTTTLPYEETNVPYYLRTLYNENCTIVLQLLLIYANENFESINVSMSDLGFVNFN